MKPMPGTRSGIVLASTTALLFGGAPRFGHARNLRRGRSSPSAVPADAAADDVAVPEEGFEVVSSNGGRVPHGGEGFEAVGGPINHDPFVDDRLHRSMLREEDEDDENAEPKEYLNDESLAFVDPEDSEHRRVEKACGGDEKLWTFKFRTDNYGYETSWSLEKRINNGEWETISSGPPPGQKYLDNTAYLGATCLKGGNMYKLTVFDDYKDGFCCNYGKGYYTYKIDDITEYDSDKKRTFAEKGEHSFYVGLPIPRNVNVTGSPFYSRSSDCRDEEQEIRIKIKTDRYGDENSWTLRNVDTGEVFAEAGLDTYGDGSADDVAVCVPRGNYTFTLTDGVGDGMCCGHGEGRYALYMDDRLMIHGSDFTSGKKREHDIIVGYDSRYDQMSQREEQYLDCHNWRRKKYHERFGASYVPLKYDLSLARDAAKWADALLDDCHVHGIKHEPGVIQGENLAKNTGSRKWGQLYPVENICRRWFEREETWDWPENAHLTQGLWRSARYLGCAESEKGTANGGTCRIQVCRYARAGNCNMGKYNPTEGDNWKIPMLMDHNPCGPICPPNGCH